MHLDTFFDQWPCPVLGLLLTDSPQSSDLLGCIPQAHTGNAVLPSPALLRREPAAVHAGQPSISRLCLTRCISWALHRRKESASVADGLRQYLGRLLALPPSPSLACHCARVKNPVQPAPNLELPSIDGQVCQAQASGLFETQSPAGRAALLGSTQSREAPRACGKRILNFPCSSLKNLAVTGHYFVSNAHAAVGREAANAAFACACSLIQGHEPGAKLLAPWSRD